MIDNIKQMIEDFVEKKNWIIQVIYLFVMIAISIIFRFDKQTTDKIIIELLFTIAAELYIISIKDSIAQKKLNRMDAKQDVDLGRLFRVADFDITPFFNNAKNDIFISGIALNGFFKNCRDNLLAFLEDEKIVRVLISSPYLIEENAKLYFGISDKNAINKSAKKIIRYQLDTLEFIMNDYNKFINNGRMQVRFSDCVFSTSFVAYDSMLQIGKGRREIKASFYQYGCGVPQKEPNILLRSDDKREWYDFFENTMTRQWNNAERVNTEIELQMLYNKLEALFTQYNS